MVAINQSNLARIVQSGIDLAITNGQLSYSAIKANNKQVSFVKDNQLEIEESILTITNQSAFYYSSFTIGNYGAHKSAGINASFVNALTGENAHTIFNVFRSRTRTTKTGMQGEQLKGNRFIITKNHDLYKTWLSTGLEMPALSHLSRYMGNLKKTLFIAEFNHQSKPDKMQASTIKALNITSEKLRLIVTNSSLSCHYGVTKPSLSVVTKDITQAQCTKASQLSSTTGSENYGNKVIREKEVRDYSLSPISIDKSTNNKRTSEQSIEEWLDDYS